MSRSLFWVTAQLSTMAVWWGVAPAVHAQCSTCGVPTVAYQPVAYQANNSGWYPGYWLNRFNTRVWGSPRTYVASYPSAYTTAYAPTYQTVGYAAYQPISSCSTCSTCFSNPCGCTTQQVVLRPACDSCSGCACSTCGCNPCGCATGVASPAVYESTGSGCSTCAPATLNSTNSSAPSTFSTEPQPELAPDADTPTQRTLVPDGTSESGSASREVSPSSSTSDGKTQFYMEPPKLFDPRDRMAARTSSVRASVYQTAASDRPSARRALRPSISRAQALLDATAWDSAD